MVRLDPFIAGTQPKFVTELKFSAVSCSPGSWSDSILLCHLAQWCATGHTLAPRHPRGKELKPIWKKNNSIFLSWMTNVEKSEGGSNPIQCLPWVFYNHRIPAERDECPLEGGREIRQHTEGGGSGRRLTPFPSFWVSDPVLSLSPSSRWNKTHTLTQQTWQVMLCFRSVKLTPTNARVVQSEKEKSARFVLVDFMFAFYLGM